jgi:periplasmic protein TonB
MMRLWSESYAKAAPAMPSAVLSVVVHAAIISGWIAGTLPAPGVESESFANRVYYIPPPDRTPSQPGSREAIHYIKMDVPGPGTGDGPHTVGDARPTMVLDKTIGDRAKDTVTAPAVPPSVGQDSVYSVLDVDVAVARSANSAAPAYPLSMLKAHISGSVKAQYVVDTTGFADTSSLKIMTATHPDFIAAVRDALPYMRFEPARIGTTKVRQLVEQQFSFRITKDTSSTTAAPKP